MLRYHRPVLCGEKPHATGLFEDVGRVKLSRRLVSLCEEWGESQHLRASAIVRGKLNPGCLEAPSDDWLT